MHRRIIRVSYGPVDDPEKRKRFAMSEYQIEKGVPAPPARTGKGRPREYPFLDMEVGDSFFAANKRMEQVATAVSHARKNTGYQFSMRSLNENGVEGVRVWRTE